MDRIKLENEMFLAGGEAAHRLSMLVDMLNDMFIDVIPHHGPYAYRKAWLIQEVEKSKAAAERFQKTRDEFMAELHREVFRKKEVA